MTDDERVVPRQIDGEQLSHELRNPLTVIIARLQLIRRRRTRGDTIPAWLIADLETIEAATVRLLALADRLEEPHDERPETMR